MSKQASHNGSAAKRGRPALALIGKRFGRLLVVARLDQRRTRHAVWMCRCDCGAETTATSTALSRGDKRSCGCLRKEYNARFSPRLEPLFDLLLAGITLENAGKLHGITRERVRQIAATRLRLVRFWASIEQVSLWESAAKASGVSLGQFITAAIAKAGATP